MRHNRGRSSLVLILFLLIGGVVGDLLGGLAARSLPLLGRPLTFSLAPTTLDVVLLKLTFGVSVSVNLLGLIGLVLAVVLWLRT